MDHFEIGLIVFFIMSLVVSIYLMLSAFRVKRDILKLSDSLRVLLRTGRSPEGIKFNNGNIEGTWRRESWHTMEECLREIQRMNILKF